MTTAESEATGRARSYDEPAAIDVLERRPLGRAIVDVVADTPPDFGVRVGLFGEWGSGKTSALNFVQEMLEHRGHIVVRFSPWGVSDARELWTRLAQQLVEELERKGNKPGTWFGRLKLKYDDGIRTLIQTATGAAEKLSPVGAFSPIVGKITQFLNTTAAQVAELAAGNERIVVMIDDVDRTDPSVVPPMLFALRELLDVKRFSWILAIDPVVVRAALKQHHPGFGLGRDFLEKIVDFSFVLPAPDPRCRVALIERDLAEHDITFADSGLPEIAESLPENPRELRAIVRHLLSIARTLRRFGPDEIDQRLLLTLVVIHASAPTLLGRLLEAQTVLKKITGLRFLKDEREKKAREAARKEIRGFLAKSDVREQDRGRVSALLHRIGDGGFWAPETVISIGRLLHTSPTMTAREAASALAEARDTLSLRTWLEEFSAREERTRPEVHSAFFTHLLATYTRMMDVASGSFSSDEMDQAIQSVLTTVRVIELLLFEIKAASDIGPAGLEDMRQRFSQWAHFEHPPGYAPVRKAERECLLRFAGAPELDAAAILDRIAPTLLWHDMDGEESQTKLNRDLLMTLEMRAAAAFINALDRQNTVADFGGMRTARKYLLRSKGLFWTSHFRNQLREILEGERSSARSDNAMDLLSIALDLPPDARRVVVADADLVDLLWKVATAVVPNMRRFTLFEDRKRKVEKAGDLTLEEPTWWQAKRAQQRASSRTVRPEPEETST